MSAHLLYIDLGRGRQSSGVFAILSNIRNDASTYFVNIGILAPVSSSLGGRRLFLFPIDLDPATVNVLTTASYFCTVTFALDGFIQSIDSPRAISCHERHLGRFASPAAYQLRDLYAQPGTESMGLIRPF